MALMFGRWMDVPLYLEPAWNPVLSNPSNPGRRTGYPERLMSPCNFQMLPVKIMKFGMTGLRGMENGRTGLLLQNLWKRSIQDSSTIKPDQVYCLPIFLFRLLISSSSGSVFSFIRLPIFLFRLVISSSYYLVESSSHFLVFPSSCPVFAFPRLTIFLLNHLLISSSSYLLVLLSYLLVPSSGTIFSVPPFSIFWLPCIAHDSVY